MLYGIYQDAGNDYIKQFLNGFSLPSALTAYSPISSDYDSTIGGSSTCPQFDLNAQAGMNGLVGVKFGYDMSSGCTVALNRSEFVDFCCANSVSCTPSSQSSYLSASGLPYFLNFSQEIPG